MLKTPSAPKKETPQESEDRWNRWYAGGLLHNEAVSRRLTIVAYAIIAALVIWLLSR